MKMLNAREYLEATPLTGIPVWQANAHRAIADMIAAGMITAELDEDDGTITLTKVNPS